MIVGIDEVGRGAWAGPLVVGAAALASAQIEGLTDSKLTTKKQRTILNQQIKQQASAIGLGWVSAAKIDQIGLSEALKLASRRALAHITIDYDEIIIDGTIRLIDDPRVTTMKKADLLIPSVSAASIIAKVARDNYMAGLDEVFAGYKFASHVGYGTAAHRKAIETHGVLPVHRRSFAPIAALSDSHIHETRDTITKNTKKLNLNTTAIGNEAESIACRYLESHGHEIVERNWKTRGCEIDIISIKNSALYFTEVKYRSDVAFRGGLAAITKQKQRQMQFAAELYLHAHKRVSAHMPIRHLSAIYVIGRSPRVVEYIETVY